MKKIKFEDALKRLEAIVDKLESGALDLEDSIKFTNHIPYYTG
jgi:exodeoxyribonuclease VII small subunit